MITPNTKKIILTLVVAGVSAALVTVAANLLVIKYTSLGVSGIEGPGTPIDSVMMTWVAIAGAGFGAYYAAVLMSKPHRWWVPLLITLIPCSCCGTCLTPKSYQLNSPSPIGIAIYVALPIFIMAYTALAWWLIWQPGKGQE